jgi:anaerobic C4-dicarboxylate transporter
VSVIVAAVVLSIALGLSWLASAVNANNNQKLLEQQVGQATTVLATLVAVIQTQMADAGHVAAVTDGRPQPFLNVAAASALSPEMSMSLWRVTGERVERLADTRRR